MDPEYTAYQRSAHARVGCVSCHIGSGAEWYVKAKLSGLRQVKAVVDGSYSAPIPAPFVHLRSAQDTCEECHWPEKFHGKKVKKFVSYTNEENRLLRLFSRFRLIVMDRILRLKTSSH
jgi:hypothetical protein